DAEAHLVAADLDHRDHDVVVDDDALVFFPGQYQHRRLSFSQPGGRTRELAPAANEPPRWLTPLNLSSPAATRGSRGGGGDTRPQVGALARSLLRSEGGR